MNEREDARAGCYRGQQPDRFSEAPENQSAEDEFVKNRCCDKRQQHEPDRRRALAKRMVIGWRLQQMEVMAEVEVQDAQERGA